MTTALSRCVGDPDGFARESWARRPLHRPGGDPNGFDDLLSLADVDRIVSSMAIRLPSFRLVKDGKTLPPPAVTKTARTGSQTVSGMADPVKIFREFERGATIVLQGVHRYWLPLARFCRELEIELGHPTQVNAYITPPGSRGLAVHRDEHDVFVLQVFGTKAWQVFEPDDDAGERRPAVDAEVGPGDCLYIPKGFPHAATAQRAASGHLTVGILSPTWQQVLDEAVAMAATEPEFAEPLPLRFTQDRERFRRAVEDRLQALSRWVEKADADEIAGRLSRRFLTKRQPLLAGQLQQLLALPNLSDDSIVARRAGSMLVLEAKDEQLAVYLGDRELRMPAWAEPAMRAIADADRLAVRDLTPYLDEESRLVLVRRLVREGLLEIVG
ncbi:MAG: cupin domain-containing protein [Actinomycetota bacterium]|nr:cupin domain-containing protein [Actinomycetota bacterium]